MALLVRVLVFELVAAAVDVRVRVALAVPLRVLVGVRVAVRVLVGIGVTVAIARATNKLFPKRAAVLQDDVSATVAMLERRAHAENVEL